MPPNRPQRHFDVAIIGGGPAGLSAGIWLSRFLHDVVVFDAGDPRNWQTRGVHGFLGNEGSRPAEIRSRGRREARRYDTAFVDTHVDRVDHVGNDEFELTTAEQGTYTGRRLLLAMGIRDYRPDIPGLRSCWGTTVHTCPNCDGYESSNAACIVLGNGRRAANVALALLTWTRDVTICTHGQDPTFDEATSETLKRTEIGVETAPVARLHHREKKLETVEFEDGRTLECQRLYIAMGQHGRDDLGAQLGCERDELGFVVIDSHHHTSVYNVFAAGDITPGAQMAVRAAAAGAEAALSIHHSLIPEQRRVHRQC